MEDIEINTVGDTSQKNWMTHSQGLSSRIEGGIRDTLSSNFPMYHPNHSTVEDYIKMVCVFFSEKHTPSLDIETISAIVESIRCTVPTCSITLIMPLIIDSSIPGPIVSIFLEKVQQIKCQELTPFLSWESRTRVENWGSNEEKNYWSDEEVAEYMKNWKSDAVVAKRIIWVIESVDITNRDDTELLLKLIMKFPTLSHNLCAKITNLSFDDIFPLLQDVTGKFSWIVFRLIDKVTHVDRPDIMRFVPVCDFFYKAEICNLASKVKITSLTELKEFLVEWNESMVKALVRANNLYNDAELLADTQHTLVLYFRYSQFHESYHESLRRVVGDALRMVEWSQTFSKVCIVLRFTDMFDMPILREYLDNPRFHFSFADGEEFKTLSHTKNIHFTHFSHGTPGALDESVGIQIVNSFTAWRNNIAESINRVIIMDEYIDWERLDEEYRWTPARDGFSERLRKSFESAFYKLERIISS